MENNKKFCVTGREGKAKRMASKVTKRSGNTSTGNEKKRKLNRLYIQQHQLNTADGIFEDHYDFLPARKDERTDLDKKVRHLSSGGVRTQAGARFFDNKKWRRPDKRVRNRAQRTKNSRNRRDAAREKLAQNHSVSDFRQPKADSRGLRNCLQHTSSFLVVVKFCGKEAVLTCGANETIESVEARCSKEFEASPHLMTFKVRKGVACGPSRTIRSVAMAYHDSGSGGTTETQKVSYNRLKLYAHPEPSEATWQLPGSESDPLSATSASSAADTDKKLLKKFCGSHRSRIKTICERVNTAFRERDQYGYCSIRNEGAEIRCRGRRVVAKGRRGRNVVITDLSPTFTIKASMLARVAMAKKLLWEHYERTRELLSREKVERAKQAAARNARMSRRASQRSRFRRAKQRKQMRSLADEARRVASLPRCVTQFCLPENASEGCVTLHHRDNKRRAAYGAYLTCTASRCLEITSLSVLLNARGTFMLTVYCADGSADAREPEQQTRFRRLTDQAVTCTDPAQPVRIDLAPDGHGIRVNFEAKVTFGIQANRKAIVYGYEEPHVICNIGNKSTEQALVVEQTKSLIGRSEKPFDRLNQRAFVGAIHFKAWFGDQTELKGKEESCSPTSG